MIKVKLFKRKPNKFTARLVEQAVLMVSGLDVLTDYMEERSQELAHKISEIEESADEIRRILIEELMKTSSAPFDREDIFTLSREIDDVLDYANTTVDEMEILDVAPTLKMQEMATLLYDASIEIKRAVERLHDRHYNVANTHTQRAKGLENRVESIYREALGDLFREPEETASVMKVFKVREIYRHLSNAADREDGAANVICDIIMKIG
jgi:predicted phosphate transport protein (TIGR00153 family)